MKLHWQILIAIVLAFALGLLLDKNSQLLGLPIYPLLGFLGSLFLQALKMLVVPLVVSSVICGVIGLGGHGALGRMGLRTGGLFLTSTLGAVLVGLLMVNLFTPGLIQGQPAGPSLNLSSQEQVAQQMQKISDKDGSDVLEVFLRMVPSNIVAAAADEGQMLGVIFFALLFGVFMLQIPQDQQATLASFWRGINETMLKMTLFVMRFAPIGVFGLVCQTAINTGLESLQVMFWFFLTVALGLLIHVAVVLALYLRLLGRVNPWWHYRAMVPALLTAFATASSNATLPVNLKCLEENAKVSRKTCSFVLPIGATVNMDGTALYECVAVVFIAQAYGLDLSFSQQLLVVVLALLTSVGVAGIPAASLVAISVILGSLGLPLEAIGLLMVTDRLLDMMRTAVNILSDSCCAVVVAKWEGEDQVLAQPPKV
jgi:proton glutamate symport protein